MHQHLADTGINLACIAKSSLSNIPPWILKMPTFIFTLHTLGNKKDTPSHEFQSWLNELLSIYDGYTRIYTDGSKEGKTVAAAAVTEGRVLMKRLPDNASIFSAEAQAILMALDIAEQSHIKKCIILSDSLSCLQSIHNRNIQNPLILKTIQQTHNLLDSGHKLTFMWLPSMWD